MTNQKKFVFKLSHVSIDTNENDIMDYLQSLGLNPISCYFVAAKGIIKPWYHVARTCVDNDDKERVLRSDTWPEGMVVSEWHFKVKD
jgi:hypothetical protein